MPRDTWIDNGYYRFFGYLNLFVFFMLMLVLANNYALLFVGWPSSPWGALPTKPNKQPAPKSKAEREALQAMFQAQNNPDAVIKAADELLTKCADTDFKETALYM